MKYSVTKLVKCLPGDPYKFFGEHPYRAFIKPMVDWPTLDFRVFIQLK